ncbi:MAG: RNA methyltransferase, partial [Thermoanaerobaculia bacterium]|nr:RNA methyltransferase [Thermoanaerobaculia bacterium]
SSVTDADSPRGVVAVGRLPRLRPEELPVDPRGLYVYADRVQDPGNLGAIARVAEAFGATALACRTGCAHPNHPRALRGSAGSLLRLPTAFPCEPRALDDRLSRMGIRWIALDAHAGVELGGGKDDLSPPLLLAVGSEGRGLSPAVEDRARTKLRIPLRDPVESLNVATAAAVVLWEVRRRR